MESAARVCKPRGMKTTIDIPDEELKDAMRFTGAATRREAVVTALKGTPTATSTS